MAHAGPNIILRVGIAVIAKHLWVRDTDMISLIKSLHRQFPIARHDLRHMRGKVAILKIKRREMIGQVFEIALKRFTIGIEIDENKPTPRPNLGLGQVHAGLIDVAEIPLSGDDLERSINIPCPAVERAAELLHASALGAQHRATVKAGVYIGPDFIGASARDNQRVMDDLVNHMIADSRDLFNPAGQLPRLAPDLFDLTVMPVFGEIAVD